MSKKVKKWLLAFCILAVAAALVYFFYYHTPKIVDFLVNDDIDGLTDYIRGKGSLGEIVLIGVQVFETLSIVLPSLPVYICAGIVFGKLEGILICYITNLVMNAIMFTFARKRRKTVNTMKVNPKARKIIDAVTGMKNPDMALVILYLIPVVPNGLIPTLAAQTRIKFSHFITELALCCLPSISICVICGDALLTVHWHIWLPLVILIAALVVLFFIFKKPLMAWVEKKVHQLEEKVTEE